MTADEGEMQGPQPPQGGERTVVVGKLAVVFGVVSLTLALLYALFHTILLTEQALRAFT